jgi:tRNA pseudouridine13 synthase
VENVTFDFQSNYQQLPRAFLGELPRGDIRSSNTDFKVEEVLPFEPSGEGEHLFLEIEKNGCNTDWVIKQIQRTFELSSKDVGYAGKKDRHSFSSQWFSLHLPGKEVQSELLECDSISVKRAVRHNKKLRVGNIKENKFEIIVRNISTKIDQQVIQMICQQGFPNYFGNQRFGRDFGNLQKANELLVNGKKIKNRNLKGLVLSSARSFLFNLQLSKRVSANNWLTIIDGDCLSLNNSQSYFHLEKYSQQEQHRVDSGDTHICGWLAGKQQSEATGSALQIEQRAIKGFENWLQALQRFNLDSQRRPYRAFAKNLKVEQQENIAVFKFSLPKGCFATALLKEIIDCVDVSRHFSFTEVSAVDRERQV